MSELSEKEKAERDGYINMALEVLKRAAAVADLEEWWVGQAGNRKYFGIWQGTPEYEKMAAACRTHKAKIRQETAA